MKKIIVVSIAFLGLTACQQDKIVFIDTSELINDYQEKKDIEAKYKAKVDVFDKKTDSLSKAFQAEAQDFDSKSKSMPQKAAQERYNQLMQKRQAVGQQLQMEQQLLSQESQTEIDSLVSKVKTFVKNYGEEKKYTFILGANEAGSVLYGEEAKDITKEVLEALNERYKKNEGGK